MVVEAIKYLLDYLTQNWKYINYWQIQPTRKFSRPLSVNKPRQYIPLETPPINRLEVWTIFFFRNINHQQTWTFNRDPNHVIFECLDREYCDDSWRTHHPYAFFDIFLYFYFGLTTYSLVDKTPLQIGGLVFFYLLFKMLWLMHGMKLSLDLLCLWCSEGHKSSQGVSPIVSRYKRDCGIQ